MKTKNVIKMNISKEDKIKKLESIKLDIILKQVATSENMGQEEDEDLSVVCKQLLILKNK